MTLGRMARPSRPSVRFTALELPTITTYVKTMKPTRPSGRAMSLKHGMRR
jgi:hypothetical protein